MFEVDPLWPKPLPNHWLLGMTIGLWVDEQDHVWIIHRGAATLHANERAPSSTRRSPSAAAARRRCWYSTGRGISCASWGGPAQGYEWPQSNHGIHVDYKGNVWIGGNGAKDAHVLKFTKDGKFLMQVGRFGKSGGSNDPENFGRVAKIWVDPKTNEAYIADGYRQQARRGARRRHRQDEALLGRLRQQARRRRSRALRSEGAAGAAVPQPRALRRAHERRARLRLRPRQQPASRSSRPKASS